ncbi:hypothetical protein [Parapedobacter pyrenivorans]|uniref:hypothetical protein n=1 Tax=Parapedobacter pyrenivorans TaxID=1305674 RepID=UPI003340490F
MKEKDTYHHVDAPDKLPDALRANPYTVPEGYFDDLYNRTLRQCRHMEETPTTFAVPSGYFQQLEDGIMAKIAEEKLRNIVGEAGFSVPEGYFSSLEEQSLANVKIRENAVEPGFAVPEHYFDTLQNRITDRTSRREVTLVRKISRPTKWVAYAAAACIAMVMGITGIFRLVDDGAETSTSPLASVSDQEILNYLELYGTANDMIYISEHLDDFDEPNINEGISEVDLEAYLNHTL